MVDREFHWDRRKAIGRVMMLAGIFMRSPRRRGQNGTEALVNASPGRLLLHCTKEAGEGKDNLQGRCRDAGRVSAICEEGRHPSASSVVPAGQRVI